MIRSTDSEDDNGVTVEETLIDIFNSLPEIKISSSDIDICHRMPSNRRDGKNIAVCKFLSRNSKYDILNAKKSARDFKYKNKSVYINDHLSSYNRNLFALAAQKKREYGFKYGRLFMRFAQLERAHYACACTDVRVSLSICVHSVLTQLRERTLGCSRPHNQQLLIPPPPPPTTRSCAAQECKAETSSIPRMSGEQWLYYVVSLIINLSFILLPWKSLQHLRRRDDDHAMKRDGDTRIAQTSL